MNQKPWNTVGGFKPENFFRPQRRAEGVPQPPNSGELRSRNVALVQFDNVLQTKFQDGQVLPKLIKFDDDEEEGMKLPPPVMKQSCNPEVTKKNHDELFSKL